jgi:hypothetical protein
MLSHNAVKHRTSYERVDECFTFQVSWNCGGSPDSPLKEFADIGMREGYAVMSRGNCISFNQALMF